MRRTIYSHCPNVDCAYHAEAPAHWYWSKGTFVTKWNHQPVPRYQCKKCRRTFSSHTFREIYKQKKPYLNEPIRQALTEAMAIRGVARSLKVSKTTVLHRLKFLGEQSKKVCEAKWAIAEAKTSYVQFDELETSERTQCLPITIAFAVQVRTGHIITARVGKVPCDNALQRVSLENFGYREDQREQTVRTMLRDIKKVVKDEDSFLIASDKHPSYSKWVQDELPFAKYERHSGSDLKDLESALSKVDGEFDPEIFSSFGQNPLWVKTQKNGTRITKAFDPLFRINQKCAVLRARLSRLRRRFWGFTQKIEYLEHHLWIFIAVNNKYKLPK